MSYTLNKDSRLVVDFNYHAHPLQSESVRLDGAALSETQLVEINQILERIQSPILSNHPARVPGAYGVRIRIGQQDDLDEKLSVLFESKISSKTPLLALRLWQKGIELTAQRPNSFLRGLCTLNISSLHLT